MPHFSRVSGGEVGQDRPLMTAFKAIRNGHKSSAQPSLTSISRVRTYYECGLLNVCFASDSGRTADISSGPVCAQTANLPCMVREAVIRVRLLVMLADPAHVNSSSSDFASIRSAVSKPSVNQP